MELNLSKKERLIRYFHEQLQEDNNPISDEKISEAEAEGKSVSIIGTAIRITAKQLPNQLETIEKGVEDQNNINAEDFDL